MANKETSRISRTFGGMEQYALAFANGLRPEPEVLVSDWCEENRVLVASSSAEPGKWRNERTPYLVEIMDCLTPFSGIEQVSVMKGAQGGFTEAGNNWIGYCIHKCPGPMLYVQPTVETVKRYSRMRLSPMIDACPELRKRISESKSRDAANTLFMKEFPGGVLVLGGSNSATALRSMPIRFLFLDECDAYPPDVDNEGDPIELAEKRTTTFRNRKIFKISTPSVVGASHIDTAYRQGDMRQWTVPCPECMEMQVLRWKFDGDDSPGGLVWKWGDPYTAAYQCPQCRNLIPEYKKTWMNSNGQWIPSREKGGDPKIRSYHWPSLYSPYGWPGSSWAELAKKWEQGHKDPTRVKVFFNTELGLPFEDKAARSVEPNMLIARCEHFPAPMGDGTIVVPNDVSIITIGADTQSNRIEYEIVGWGRAEESWSIFYGIESGDTTMPAPFMALDRAINQRFQNEAGVELRVAAVCVDANYSTQMVTTWCGPKFNRRVWAVRGAAGKRAIWPRIPGYSKYNRTPLFTVGVDAAKDSIVGRLAVEEPGPGFSHFPMGRQPEYFEQLTAEKSVILYDRNPPYSVWKKKDVNARNEGLDCRVYAYAGLCGLLSGGLKIDEESSKMAVKTQAKLDAIIIPKISPGVLGQSRVSRFQMRS